MSSGTGETRVVKAGWSLGRNRVQFFPFLDVLSEGAALTMGPSSGLLIFSKMGQKQDKE